jgi:predicted nucleic-acid-binding Zn-ribbon protein
MEKLMKYKCPKCNHTQAEIGEIRVSGSFAAKLFNIQNKKFTSVTCKRCSYTELYATDSSKLGNVFDFFVG